MVGATEKDERSTYSLVVLLWYSTPYIHMVSQVHPKVFRQQRMSQWISKPLLFPHLSVLSSNSYRRLFLVIFMLGSIGIFWSHSVWQNHSGPQHLDIILFVH